VLPTGAGKSHVAVMAMAVTRRATLVVAPTLDLVRQWHGLLKTSFGCEVGVVGGGDHEVRPITVTTYDSAYLHMEHLGARFGLVVFDECHHLPGESFAFAAEQCLAPYRLGLTATPERSDGRHTLYEKLIGPTVHEQAIVQLAGDYLADYDVERIVVSLTSAERAAYESHRAVYLGFVRSHGIRLGAPNGWATFLMRTAGSEAGQRALESYRAQKRLALCAEGKLDVVGDLLDLHRHDRALLFTQDNATAYAISRRFLVPVITHQTRVSERTAILEGLASGRFAAIVTSKVLNEGVDVPSANVAIVISGSGSVREHVQRLGRVLRKQGDKRAVLYELVSGDTSEQFTSDRRREHVAYRDPDAEDDHAPDDADADADADDTAADTAADTAPTQGAPC
jgi:superfamily II DNA or RNA helicase